jgi:hypothetical protein
MGIWETCSARQTKQLELDLWTQPEQWLPVISYEGLYEVSDQGRVRSLHTTGRVLKPSKHRSGHLHVNLHRQGRKETRKVHCLVLEAFIGPRPPGTECCHYNDIPSDNRLENLRWDTRSANQRDRVRNGNDANARKTRCPRGHPYNRHCSKHATMEDYYITPVQSHIGGDYPFPATSRTSTVRHSYF